MRRLRDRQRETIVKNVRDRQARGVYRATTDPWATAELIQMVQNRLLAEGAQQPPHEAEAQAQRIFAGLAAGLTPEEPAESAAHSTSGSYAPHDTNAHRGRE